MAPRYSIIRGDFPEDQRADVGHFRVYTLIGRHTDENGWCRLKQITIGDEVGLSRKTVNLKIKDLVEWGYVEKREHDGSGRAIWYRTIMDARVAPPEAFDDDADDGDAACETQPEGDRGPVTQALQVGPTCNLHRVTPGVTTGRNTERPLLNDKYPLPHGAKGATGDSGKSDLVSKGRLLLAAAIDSGAPADVAEMLLRPILERRRFSAAAPAAELVRLAKAAEGIPAEAVHKAAELVLALDIATIKPQRIADAIATVREGGAMVVIRRGTAQWQRWLEYFAACDPRQAATLRRTASIDTWQVPSEWPPAQATTEPQRGAA